MTRREAVRNPFVRRFFGSGKRLWRRARNENEAKPLNKQNGEMTDSALIMISMTYDSRCEMLRFPWRNIPFVLGGFSRFGAGNKTAGDVSRRREKREIAALDCTSTGARRPRNRRAKEQLSG
jgi:hypothetical protein